MDGITIVLTSSYSDNDYADKEVKLTSDPNESCTTFILGRNTEGIHIDDKRCSRSQAKIEVHNSTNKVQLMWVQSVTDLPTC